jgi:predicted aspartyl protease
MGSERQQIDLIGVDLSCEENCENCKNRAKSTCFSGLPYLSRRVDPVIDKIRQNLSDFSKAFVMKMYEVYKCAIHRVKLKLLKQTSSPFIYLSSSGYKFVIGT